MLDHVALNVKDLKKSRLFYAEAPAPLGLRVQMEFEEGCGFGPEGKPGFWLIRRDPVGGSAHVAFQSRDRKSVDAFHAAALAAGGRDHGAPGIRPHYHAGYYPRS